VKIYSEIGRQRFRQVVADLVVLAWIAFCSAVGWTVFKVTNLLGAPGRKAAEAGDGLAEQLRRVAGPAGDVPAVVDRLRAPFDAAAGAATKLADAGREQAEAVEQFAIVLGIATAAVPILFALLIWLPPRIRFSRRATAAQRFIDSAADLDLFALRAMANQPMHKLAQISNDPVKAWREGDTAVIDRLATLELRASGLKPPREPLRGTEPGAKR
jgi:hypothetical protein